MSYYITERGTIIDNENVKVVMTDGDSTFEKYKEYLQNDGEVIPTDFVTEDEIIELQKFATIKKYEQFRIDGISAYEDYRAIIVSKVFKKELSETQAFLISKYLSSSFDKIKNNGDWKTALFELDSISIPDKYDYIIEYKNEALELMQNYIAENY